MGWSQGHPAGGSHHVRGEVCSASMSASLSAFATNGGEDVAPHHHCVLAVWTVDEVGIAEPGPSFGVGHGEPSSGLLDADHTGFAEE